MAMLTFSMSFTTIAQQNEEEPITIETFVSIAPAEIESPAAGEQLTVSINIADSVGVTGIQGTVNFDPTALRYVSVQMGDYVPVGSHVEPPIVSDNNVLFAVSFLGIARSGDGTVATVTFEVVEAKASTISLMDVVLADAENNWLDFVIADTTTVTANVEFRDVNLAKKVREALNLPAGAAIPKAQLATLTFLDASAPQDTVAQEKISDLTGLEHATQLMELYLWRNQIRNITPLAGLTQLVELNLDGNQINDIRPLAELTQLKALYLGGNRISDIRPLVGLTQLTVLSLIRNRISDLSPLVGLTQLTRLYLGTNLISDITPLAGLTQLTRLYLGANLISDITPLAGLTQLTRLDLWYNLISNITPLTGLTQLTRLYLSDNRISDITPLVGLTQLTYLYLGFGDRGQPSQ